MRATPLTESAIRATPTRQQRFVARDNLSPVAALVRRHDRDRYQTALFAPAERREALFALYAFNYEIARVREAASEPILGQMRLQWWRENVEAAFAEKTPRRHDVVEALSAVIRQYWPTRACFDRLIDAREHDFDPEPPAAMTALEEYAEETSSTLISLALEVLGATEPVAAARPVGIAYALSGLLRAMPFHARAGRCYIPVEVTEAAGLDLRDYAALRAPPALRAAVKTMAERAARHLGAAGAEARDAPRAALPALLPAVIAGHTLARLRRNGFDPFDARLAAPDPPQAWRLAAAMLRRRL